MIFHEYVLDSLNQEKENNKTVKGTKKKKVHFSKSKLRKIQGYGKNLSEIR